MKLLAAFGTALLLASAPIAAQATTISIVFDDHFSNANVDDPSFQTGNSLVKWGTVGSTPVNCGDPSAPTCIAADTDFRIRSDEFALEAGALYNYSVLFQSATAAIDMIVEFNFGDGSPMQSESKTIAQSLSTTFNGVANFMVLQNTTGYFVIHGTTNDAPGVLAYLDRVTLTKTVEDTSPVPLPASAPLLLAGLGAVGLMRRKRKA